MALSDFLSELAAALASGGLPQILAVFAIIAFAFLITFIVFRPGFPNIYWPRELENAGKYAKTFYAGWITRVMFMEDNEFRKIAGLNGYLYLKLLRHLLIYLGFCSIVSMVVLLPIHLTQKGKTDIDPDRFNQNFVYTTASSVPAKSGILWVHLALTFVFTATGLFVFSRFQTFFLDARYKYRQEQPLSQQRTVYITNLPHTANKQLIASFFTRLFPKRILGVHPAVRSKKIIAAIKERRRALNGLEKAEEFGKVQTTSSWLRAFRCMLWPRAMGHWDDPAYWRDRYLKATRSLEGIQQELKLIEDTSPIHSVHVTFIAAIDAEQWVREFNEPRRRELFLRQMADGKLTSSQNINRDDNDRVDLEGSIGDEFPEDDDFAGFFGGRMVKAQRMAERRQTQRNKESSGGNSVPPSPAKGTLSPLISTSGDVEAPEKNVLSSYNPADEIGEVSILHQLKPHQWVVKPAIAPPEGLLWANLNTSQPVRLILKVFANLLVIIISFLWTLPLIYFGNIRTFAKNDPSLNWMLDLPNAVLIFIESMLPLLMIVVFYLILPALMRAIAKLEKPHSLGKLERSTYQKYLFFVLLNLLIFKTLLDTGFGLLSTVTTKLKTNHFFDLFLVFENINYIRVTAILVAYLIKDTVTTCLADLAQVGNLIRFGFKKLRKFMMQTSRPIKTRLQYFQTSVQFGIVMLAFTIGIAYGLVVPIILPVTTFYLGVKLFVDKSNMVLVHPTDNRKPGNIITSVINSLYASLVLFQLTMMFFFLSKGSVPCAALTFIMAWATIIAAVSMKLLRLQHKNFELFNIGHVTEEMILDHHQIEGVRNAYMHPGMKPSLLLQFSSKPSYLYVEEMRELEKQLNMEILVAKDEAIEDD